MQSVCHKAKIEYVRSHARDRMYEMSWEEGRSLLRMKPETEGFKDASPWADINKGRWEDVPRWGKNMLGKDEVFQLART